MIWRISFPVAFLNNHWQGQQLNSKRHTDTASTVERIKNESTSTETEKGSGQNTSADKYYGRLKKEKIGK